MKLDGKIWAVGTNRAAKEAWRLNQFVYLPMDISTITEKASAGKWVIF
jgi:hypothetical protein